MQSFVTKARFLSLLSNEARLKILTIVSKREASVGDLSQKLRKSQSSVSQHLSRLREDGVVDTRREAQTIYYYCSDSRVTSILRVLEVIFEAEGDRHENALQQPERQEFK
ncbi:ArsR/SmtB family transcription factor [Agrobacterium larrymoorei]|uniref:Helix-turn-helix transcriptional regulator n=1 Tax=Agrobacterium larrymoorei TaxID=160699 RepID=A0ABX8T924_9HYPH|nr:metalloregulator ArsR/SmtB family transcription factor [Agrobacterium larrymoorei]QYA08693.1 helix-turn-helix transcriptional regulator [Agrobacterium larrymoorei]